LKGDKKRELAETHKLPENGFEQEEKKSARMF
jgi:hypothetical protein